MIGYSMRYLLVTPVGQEFEFYIEEMALLYQKIYGGDILRKEVTVENFLNPI